MTDKHEEIVQACFEACRALDADRMVEHFSDEAVFWNAPVPPIHGKAKIRGTLQRLFSLCTSLEIDVHSLAVAESTVLMERTDTVDVRGVSVSAPIAGVVYFRGDRIIAWRDYFDLLHLLRQTTLQSARRVLRLLGGAS